MSSQPGDESENESGRRPYALIAYIAVGIVAVVAGVFALSSGGDEDEAGAPTTTSAPVSTVSADPGSDPTPGTTRPTVPEPIGNTTPSTEAPTGATLPPAEVTVDRNPLTGELLAQNSSNRVIAVKVDNVGDARPQLGLLEAEMIIETPVEGGLTRLTALYFDARPRGVGPVRSMRPVDADLLAPFRPILMSSGGRDFVRRDIAAAGIEIIDTSAGELFQRIERPAPHNLVATVAQVAAEREPGAPLATPFRFGDEPLDGDPVSAVTIPFSSAAEVEWRFDGEQWERFENGEAFGTLVEYGGEIVPLTVDTVLVLSVAQRSAGYTDNAGADVPTFDVIGFGRFTAFSGGEMVTGEWRRAAQSDGFFLIGSDGNLVTLPVGRLFVEIVPRSIEVSTSN